MGEANLSLFRAEFNQSLRIEARPERLTADAGAVVLREVMERLGIGPEVCLARNPKLVFGRMTGWGQDGPYAPWSGHDINYIAIRS